MLGTSGAVTEKLGKDLCSQGGKSGRSFLPHTTMSSRALIRHPIKGLGRADGCGSISVN